MCQTKWVATGRRWVLGAGWGVPISTCRAIVGEGMMIADIIIWREVGDVMGVSVGGESGSFKVGVKLVLTLDVGNLNEFHKGSPLCGEGFVRERW